MERGQRDHRADQGDHALERPSHAVGLARLPTLGSLALLAILIVVLAGGGDDDDRPADDRADELTAPVVDVIDGDTIEVRIDGEIEDVRYIGVDTPESVAPGQPIECFGPEASRENARLVAGEIVRLIFDAERRDRYGRLLAYVYVGERFVNAELVGGGYATTLTIPPNDSFAARFNRLEQSAGNAGRGLWSAC